MSYAKAEVRVSIRDYLELTKPRITVLILVTTLTTMWLAAEGVPSALLMINTVLGTALASSSAAVINHYIDREIDNMMERTKKRAIPSGRIEPVQSLAFGLLLTVLSFAVLATTVNLLTAVIAILGIFYYVIIYTAWLKRKTPQNIVIGGGAGAVGPLIGWAAVTGSIGLEAIILFFVIFFWTPPHFWSLALIYKEDYARARIPMFPVVYGEDKTRWQIVFYSIILFISSTMLYLLSNLSLFYMVSQFFLGLLFVGLSVYLLLRKDNYTAKQLFIYSIAYLFLLFVIIMLDVQFFS